MTLHNILPFVAFLLNVSLAGIALVRNPRSRLNRLFAYFVSAMALWNFGVFMLRLAPEPRSAYAWEVVIHVGVIAVPVFYYHFILIFLDSTTRHRRSLMLGYGLLALFMAVNLVPSSLFMKGVIQTYWGWAPATGPLYTLFFVYLYAFFITGLVRLWRSYRGIDSSFRRNRALLIVLGTVVTIGGGFIDFVRFLLAKSFPIADQFYPVGIPANMLCALLLAVSIVRYRMFDVDVAVKKAAVYGGVGVVLTSLLVLLTWTFESMVGLAEASAVWAVVPLGVVMTLLISPFGQRLEGQIERLIFSRRRGCYDTLLELSRRMSQILDLDVLRQTLVRGLLRGIPLTHCVLLTCDDESDVFTVALEEAAVEQPRRAAPVSGDSRLVEWLRQADTVLVKEELKLNPMIAEHFAGAEPELEAIEASLIVPLKTENKLAGLLLLGEKLSGEIFGTQELEMLWLLATQAAISLENARLYDELGTTNAQLRQASRLKSQFLAAVSHELRTPLNSIVGFSKVLLNRLDGDLNERQEAYLRSVHTSSQHLLQLINSILDISSIEAGRLLLERVEFDVDALVDECIEVSAALVRGKTLRIEKDLGHDLPSVSADRTKVRQVLLNLLSNAVKFTPGGRVVVVARIEAEALHVSVSDTGVGIRKADLERLFEPFERLDNRASRDAGGTGLGLAISKKFVELHGGRMWAESRERGGSVFHFTLPLAAPVPAAT